MPGQLGENKELNRLQELSRRIAIQYDLGSVQVKFTRTGELKLNEHQKEKKLDQGR